MIPKKQHFIIVDDDRDVRYFIRRVILRHFPEAGISEAGDGQEALRMYEQLNPDLMVIDHDLPLLNGADLIRELRTRQPALPLVMVSNFPAARELAMAAGATMFFEKGAVNAGLAGSLPALLPEGHTD